MWLNVKKCWKMLENVIECLKNISWHIRVRKALEQAQKGELPGGMEAAMLASIFDQSIMNLNNPISTNILNLWQKTWENFQKNKTCTSNSPFASSNAIHATSNWTMLRFSCCTFHHPYFVFVDVKSEFDRAKTAIATTCRKHLQTFKIDILNTKLPFSNAEYTNSISHFFISISCEFDNRICNFYELKHEFVDAKPTTPMNNPMHKEMCKIEIILFMVYHVKCKNKFSKTHNNCVSKFRIQKTQFALFKCKTRISKWWFGI